jgi:hypothetical protein
MNSKMLSSIRTGTVAASRSAVLKSYLHGSSSVSSAQCSFSSQATAGVVQVPIDEARSMTAKALKMIGWDDDDAALQAEIMTAAELCGNNQVSPPCQTNERHPATLSHTFLCHPYNSQGLVKMYNPVMMTPAPNASKPVIERETSTSAVINGNQAPGMLAAVTAADLAVKKVKASVGPSIAIVCTNNTSTSSGQLAFYVERMARQGIIGIAMCNSPEFVAAAKGGKPVFGTNPLAVGIPVKGCVPFTVRYIRYIRSCIFFVFLLCGRSICR